MFAGGYFHHSFFAAGYFAQPGVSPTPPTPPGPPQFSGITGDFGEVVSIPFVECFEDFGIMAGIFKDRNNLRMEYRKRGKDLDINTPFEIPDHYVKYVRWYALARMLEHPGPGQDMELAAWYQARWTDGIQRMITRRNALQSQRKYVMGGTGSSVLGKAPPKARLPWTYGHVVR